MTAARDYTVFTLAFELTMTQVHLIDYVKIIQRSRDLQFSFRINECHALHIAPSVCKATLALRGLHTLAILSARSGTAAAISFFSYSVMAPNDLIFSTPDGCE